MRSDNTPKPWPPEPKPRVEAWLVLGPNDKLSHCAISKEAAESIIARHYPGQGYRIAHVMELDDVQY